MGRVGPSTSWRWGRLGGSAEWKTPTPNLGGSAERRAPTLESSPCLFTPYRLSLIARHGATFAPTHGRTLLPPLLLRLLPVCWLRPQENIPLYSGQPHLCYSRLLCYGARLSPLMGHTHSHPGPNSAVIGRDTTQTAHTICWGAVPKSTSPLSPNDQTSPHSPDMGGRPRGRSFFAVRATVTSSHRLRPLQALILSHWLRVAARRWRG